MNNLGERIRYLRQENKLSMAKLADAINVRSSNISDWENNNTNPSSNNLLSLSKFFNISSDWLLTGEDKKELDSILLREFQMLTEEDQEDLNVFLEFLKLRREKKKDKNVVTSYINNDEPQIEAIKENSTVYLPILGEAAAGKPIEIVEVYEGDAKVDGSHDRSNSFIIKARGDSMVEAGINDGDLVVFKTQPAVENGEIALMNVNGEATIKYFYLRNGICELHSANPAYPPMEYTSGDIKVLGKFVEVIEQR